MTSFHAFILGIVEGITEFLPISSTGHLILASRMLGLSSDLFLTSFEIAIQLGAILSVVVLYAGYILKHRKIFGQVTVAFIPTAVLGLLFYKIVKRFLLEGESLVLTTMFLGGLFLIVFEMLHRENTETAEDMDTITYRQAFLIGIFQSLAMIPGVSRSAATICGGLLLGLRRKTIVEFSFLLAIPTMLAATGLDILKSGSAFSNAQWQVLLVGFITSFIVAILSIRFLLRFIKSHNFIPFGIYRIAAAVLFWMVFRG